MNSPRLQVGIFVLFLVPAFCASSARGDTVIFVDGDATAEPHDGSTWCNAFVTLDEALDAASAGDIIRIANGTYTPDPSGLPDPREATFQLVNAVRIEGGYAGCGAPDPDERDFDLYETILSGDLTGDDGPDFANNDENCYHVITADATLVDLENTVVDGVTITGETLTAPISYMTAAAACITPRQASRSRTPPCRETEPRPAGRCTTGT